MNSTTALEIIERGENSNRQISATVVVNKLARKNSESSSGYCSDKIVVVC